MFHYFCFCIILYVPGVFKSNQNAVFQTPLNKPFPMRPDVVLTWAFASSWAAGCVCLNIAGLNYTVKQSGQEKVVVSKWSHTASSYAAHRIVFCALKLIRHETIIITFYFSGSLQLVWLTPLPASIHSVADSTPAALCLSLSPTSRRVCRNSNWS